MIRLTDAERAMVWENRGLVGAVLVQMSRGRWDGEEEADEFQDGIEGLAEAVRHFDPAKGKLSTLAYMTIRQSIQHGRGRRRGLAYRRAVDEGSYFRKPYSLDLPAFATDSHAETLAEGLADPYSPLVDEHHDHRVELLLDAVRNDTERAILLETPERMADVLGIDVSSVKRRRARIQARLRAQFAEAS